MRSSHAGPCKRFQSEDVWLHRLKRRALRRGSYRGRGADRLPKRHLARELCHVSRVRFCDKRPTGLNFETMPVDLGSTAAERIQTRGNSDEKMQIDAL